MENGDEYERPWLAAFASLRVIGLAYATLAVGAASAARNPSDARVVTAMLTAHLGGHALFYLCLEPTARNAGAALAEAPGIYGPALFAVMLFLRVSLRREKMALRPLT